ncbi:DUF1572 family protein [Dyadobacter sp. NIV53]|uniref:DUF1572 family protein n=1 Tax=Dyadobacter sp. NIV53 TaxID=2861765 RepID=UPI001C8735F2|nr:DUF1572 family protein [Dyadobacter sp. NIV53]
MNCIEFKRLFVRELEKLRSEVELYHSDDQMWLVLPGTINSGGNLVQHLVGNLRTYIGLTLGDTAYIRNRDAEFGERLFTQENLLQEIELLKTILSNAIETITDETLQHEYPHEVLTIFPEQSISTVLTHLLMHLTWHTGQINYHRRYFETTKNEE